MEIALTYIYGIGRSVGAEDSATRRASIRAKKSDDLTDDE